MMHCSNVDISNGAWHAPLLRFKSVGGAESTRGEWGIIIITDVGAGHLPTSAVINISNSSSSPHALNWNSLASHHLQLDNLFDVSTVKLHVFKNVNNNT